MAPEILDYHVMLSFHDFRLVCGSLCSIASLSISRLIRSIFRMSTPSLSTTSLPLRAINSSLFTHPPYLFVNCFSPLYWIALTDSLALSYLLTNSHFGKRFVALL